MISDLDANFTAIREATGAWGLPGLPDGVMYDLAVSSGMNSQDLSGFLNGLAFDYSEKEKEANQTPALDPVPTSLSPMASGIARPWAGMTQPTYDRSQAAYQPSPLQPEPFDLSPFQRPVRFFGGGVPMERALASMASMDDAKIYDPATIRQLKADAIAEGILPPNTPINDAFHPNLNNVTHDLAEKKANRAMAGERPGAVSLPQVLNLMDEFTSPTFLANLAWAGIVGANPGEIVQGVKSGLESWGDFSKVGQAEGGWWGGVKAFFNALAGPLDDIIVPVINIALLATGMGEVLAIARLGRAAGVLAKADDILAAARVTQMTAAAAGGRLARAGRFLGIGTDAARVGWMGTGRAGEVATAAANLDLLKLSQPGRLVQRGAASENMLFRGWGKGMEAWRGTHAAVYGRKTNQIAMRMGQWNYMQAQIFDNPTSTEVRRIREYRMQNPNWTGYADLVVDSFFSPWRIREWSTLKPQFVTNKITDFEQVIEELKEADLADIGLERRGQYVAVRNSELLQNSMHTNWVSRGLAERLAAKGSERYSSLATRLRTNARSALVDEFKLQGAASQRAAEAMAANYVRLAIASTAVEKATAYRLSVFRKGSEIAHLSPSERLARMNQIRQKTFSDLTRWDENVDDFLEFKRRQGDSSVYHQYLDMHKDDPTKFFERMGVELQDHNAKAAGMMKNMIDTMEADEVYKYIVAGHFDHFEDFGSYIDATNTLHDSARPALINNSRRSTGATPSGRIPRDRINVQKMMAPGGPGDDLAAELLNPDPVTGFARIDTKHWSLMAGDNTPIDAWWKFTLARPELVTATEMRQWLIMWNRSVEVAEGVNSLISRSEKTRKAVGDLVTHLATPGRHGAGGVGRLAELPETEQIKLVRSFLGSVKAKQVRTLIPALDWMVERGIDLGTANKEIRRHMTVLDRAAEWDDVFGFGDWAMGTQDVTARVQRKIKEGFAVAKLTADDAEVFIPVKAGPGVPTPSPGARYAAPGQLVRPPVEAPYPSQPPSPRRLRPPGEVATMPAGPEPGAPPKVIPGGTKPGVYMPVSQAIAMGLEDSIPKPLLDIHRKGYKVVVGEEFFPHTKLMYQVLPDLNLARSARRMSWEGIKNWMAWTPGAGVMKRLERIEGSTIHRAREAAWSEAIAKTVNRLIDEGSLGDVPALTPVRHVAPDSREVTAIRHALENYSEQQLAMRNESLLEGAGLWQRNLDRQAAAWSRRLPDEIGLRTLADIQVTPGVKISDLIPNRKDLKRLRNALRTASDLSKRDRSLRPGLLWLEDMMRNTPWPHIPLHLLSRTVDHRAAMWRVAGRGGAGAAVGYMIGKQDQDNDDPWIYPVFGGLLGAASAKGRWAERLAGIGQDTRSFTFLSNAAGATAGAYLAGGTAAAMGVEGRDRGFAAAGGAFAGLVGGPALSHRALQAMSHHAMSEFWYLPRHLMNVSNHLRFSLSPVFDIQRYTEGAAMRWAADPQKYGLDPHALEVLSNRPIRELAGRSKRRFITHGEYNGKKGIAAWQDALTDFDRAADRAGQVPFEAGDRTVRWMLDEGVMGFNPYERMVTTYAELVGEGIEGGTAFRIANDLYTYGVKGRTNLELAVNSVFFPFSFQARYAGRMARWLTRDMGRALLVQDALTTANMLVDKYDMDVWVDEHLPLLNQLRKINQLAYGFSLGEAGGLYRPLLDFFIPQAMTVLEHMGDAADGAPIVRVATETGEDLILDMGELTRRSVSAWRDIDDLIDDVKDQGHVIFGPSHMTPDAEANQGFLQLDQLNERLEQTGRNAGFEDFAAFKAAFPANAAVIEAQYEAAKAQVYHFHPSLVQVIADSNKTRIASDMVLKDRTKFPKTTLDWETREFLIYLDTLKKRVEAGGGDFEEVAEVPIWAQQGIRAKATELAMRNNGFEQLYDKYYRKVWGRIQSIAYGAGYVAPPWSDSAMR